jgi:hypothetical protein
MGPTAACNMVDAAKPGDFHLAIIGKGGRGKN